MGCYVINAIVIVFKNFYRFVLEQENACKVLKTMISPTSTERLSQTFRFSHSHSKRVGNTGQTAYKLYLVKMFHPLYTCY